MWPSLLVALAAVGAGQSVPGVGDVVCRYKAKTPSAVNYYTCSELASKYVTTVEQFFELNPGVTHDCSNINPSSEYCVKGYIQYAVSTDGFCGPYHGNASCSGTDVQCCNSETWKCGATEQDCAPGTCWEGACKGFPSRYSMDGRCGAAANGLLCGGKWGNCCSKYGYCGNGTNYCSLENCYSGDCEIPVRSNNGLPWLTGTTRNGSCGGAEGYTCDVAFGNCCSKDGVCGALVEHCGTGCQPQFGLCSTSTSAKPTSTRSSTSSLPSATKVSTDGSCGGSNRIICKGSTFGNCCSSSGYCGSSSNYCGTGCQSAFGDCSATGTTTKTTSSAAPSPTNLSTDGSCGGANKYRCPGSGFGDCCSSSGYCGSSTGHCGAGCQSTFGTCSVAADVSPDGTCGGAQGYKCAGSAFGNCCSANGYCGSSTGHCGNGCQSAFGACTATTNVSPDGTCGGAGGYKCTGSSFGNCCSANGFCGSSSGHCGMGCQPGFGTCPGISPDGTCGGANGYKCAGSGFGDCCSPAGYRGSTADYCGTGCQAAFGKCPGVSTDGTCGGTNGFRCGGSTFGNCCSATGYCGSSADHCGSGCQAAFGTCPGVSTDGTCGGSQGLKCSGSTFGNCCSAAGYCGSSSDHCGTGCQAAFGTCPGVSTDGTCGGSKGLKCGGSTYGNCCSANGFCGSAVEHCAQGCQQSFSSSCMTSNVPTLDGTCGPAKGGYTCAGGPFNGQCCAASGFCGSTSSHCGTGCQSGFGACS